MKQYHSSIFRTIVLSESKSDGNVSDRELLLELVDLLTSPVRNERDKQFRKELIKLYKQYGNIE